MRLMHLGDLHLGKSVNEFNMIEDQRYILEEILDMIEEKHVDGLLIAGDVYDKSIPSEEAVRLLDWFLAELSGRQVPVYMISGNHDSDERLNFGSRLFETNGIHIAAKYEGHIAHYLLKDEFGEVDIWLLPFVKASLVKHYYPEAKIENYEDAVRAAIAGEGIDPSRRNVLVAHQFVVGSHERDEMQERELPELAGSEGSSVLNVGTVEQIGSACFDEFSYVALGHIHSPQAVGRPEVRYSGSPLKYSLSEAGRDKSVPLVEIDGEGKVAIELLPLHPLRNMRHLTGPINVLLDPAHVEDTTDYIYVTLTDDDVVLDAMSRIRQVYPNTMKLDYHNQHTEGVESVDFTLVTKEKSFREIAGDFYRQMYGCEISEKEQQILEDIAGRIGLG